MRIHTIPLMMAFAAALAPSRAAAQNEAHQATTSPSADMARCAQVQPAVQNIIAATTAGLEAARQSNSPAEMRAAIDNFEAALRNIRTQLAPCATAPTEPHAGHTMPSTQAAPVASAGDAAVIEARLKDYDAAFSAKDLEKLATFYHPNVTIYEGGGIDTGWTDYRDRHLGPELKAFENLQFGHANSRVTVLPGDQAAYVTSEYWIKAKMGDREIDSRGLETLVVVKGSDGAWRIRHSHTSSRPARRPAV